MKGKNARHSRIAASRIDFSKAVLPANQEPVQDSHPLESQDLGSGALGAFSTY